MPKVVRNKLGPIPDDHFENEPTYPPKNVLPFSKELVEWVEKLKADKNRPCDVVGGMSPRAGRLTDSH
jgi:hypothetical protein